MSPSGKKIVTYGANPLTICIAAVNIKAYAQVYPNHLSIKLHLWAGQFCHLYRCATPTRLTGRIADFGQHAVQLIQRMKLHLELAFTLFVGHQRDGAAEQIGEIAL